MLFHPAYPRISSTRGGLDDVEVRRDQIIEAIGGNWRSGRGVNGRYAKPIVGTRYCWLRSCGIGPS